MFLSICVAAIKFDMNLIAVIFKLKFGHTYNVLPKILVFTHSIGYRMEKSILD